MQQLFSSCSKLKLRTIRCFKMLFAKCATYLQDKSRNLNCFLLISRFSNDFLFIYAGAMTEEPKNLLKCGAVGLQLLSTAGVPRMGRYLFFLYLIFVFCIRYLYLSQIFVLLSPLLVSLVWAGICFFCT